MKNKTNIDDMIESFDSDDNQSKKSSETFPLTLWVSADAKQKYDQIQRRSNRRFSRLLKEVVETSIDRKFERDGDSPVA